MRTLISRTLQTTNDPVLTLTRLAIGVLFFLHGSQKMLGWFGGYGFAGTMGFFTEKMGLPPFLAFLAIATEFFGPLALLAGFLTRPAAFALTIFTVVAAAQHVGNGFFMNWFGNQKGEGYEIHLLMLTLLVTLLVRGAGALSLDGWLTQRLRGSRETPTDSSTPVPSFS
jgi:putative oxidoreductase